MDEPGLFGRKTKGEVVLVPRLRAALERLNPELPSEAIDAAVEELTRDRSSMLLEQANREVYSLLKEGVRVSFVDSGATAERTILLIPDFAKASSGGPAISPRRGRRRS